LFPLQDFNGAPYRTPSTGSRCHESKSRNADYGLENNETSQPKRLLHKLRQEIQEEKNFNLD